jgi:hypothetical protein
MTANFSRTATGHRMSIDCLQVTDDGHKKGRKHQLILRSGQ